MFLGLQASHLLGAFASALDSVCGDLVPLNHGVLLLKLSLSLEEFSEGFCCQVPSDPAHHLSGDALLRFRKVIVDT